MTQNQHFKNNNRQCQKYSRLKSVRLTRTKLYLKIQFQEYDSEKQLKRKIFPIQKYILRVAVYDIHLYIIKRSYLYIYKKVSILLFCVSSSVRSHNTCSPYIDTCSAHLTAQSLCRHTWNTEVDRFILSLYNFVLFKIHNQDKNYKRK